MTGAISGAEGCFLLLEVPPHRPGIVKQYLGIKPYRLPLGLNIDYRLPLTASRPGH